MYQASNWSRISQSQSGNSHLSFKVRWFTIAGTYAETGTRVLNPGGSTIAYPWDYSFTNSAESNSASKYTSASGIEYTIHDPFFRCYAMSGETVPCVFNPQSCRWEVIAEFGLTRFAWLQPVGGAGEIAYGSIGAGYIKPSHDPWNTTPSPLDGGPTVTVLNGGVHDIQVDGGGVRGVIRFFQSNLTTDENQHPGYFASKWIIMDAECPVTP